MKINVLFAPELTDELYFSGRTSIVIDVLRASTTIITAVANGAKEVIPVISVDSAVKISKGLYSGSTVLGGERNTKKVDGFHLGNSPLEYTPEKINGKSIIFFTTNGTKAILKAKFSESLLICGFININSVVQKIISINKDIEIVCAGNPASFSMEDVVCAGMIISEIKKTNTDVVLTDSSKAAEVLYESSGKDIRHTLTETEHGKVLLKNGYEEDITFCSKLNTTEVIPYLSGNVIKLLSGK
jgi:2-phosphosulfolactate phosphatase